MPIVPIVPPAFFEDDVLDLDWDAVDWLTIGVRPVVDDEADLIP